MFTAIGIDVGGTKVRAARISSNGEVLEKTCEHTCRDPAVLLDRLAALIGQMSDATTRAVGLGVPGRVDAAKGLVLSGGYVDLSVVPLRAEIERRAQHAVFIDNDCSMALVGEAALGAARGARTAAMLTLGTGIGGALLQDGRILHGRRCAGQFGHIVVDVAGPLCICGRRGCVETMSSGTSLGRIISEHHLPSDMSIETIIERADVGDPVASSVLERWGRPLGAAVDTIASAFDPDIVVLGGGLGQAGCDVMERIPRASSWGEMGAIAPAALGDDAGIIGAALAALERATLKDLPASALRRNEDR